MYPKTAEILRGNSVPALLLSHPISVRVCTGARASEGLVLLTRRSVRLFVDGREREAAKAQAAKGVRVLAIEQFASALRRIPRCGCEAEHVTVVRLKRWKKLSPRTRFLPRGQVLWEWRRLKQPEERAAMRRALRITDAMLRRVPALLTPGISETALAWRLEVEARRLGADGLAFPPIVAFGTHTSMPHHHPAGRRLKRGHLVLVDVGAKVDGYCADRTEMFFTAKPTRAQRRALDAVREAQRVAAALVRPGIAVRELDRAARAVLRRYGMEKAFTHALGHGVGLEIHEGVSLSSKSSDVLLAGEAITIEPGVYFPGKFGIRLETMVFVGESKNAGNVKTK